MEEYSKIVIENDGNDTDFCKTFVIFDEDHTLANALRYLIMKNPVFIFWEHLFLKKQKYFAPRFSRRLCFADTRCHIHQNPSST
jgi:hypothetical protein